MEPSPSIETATLVRRSQSGDDKAWSRLVDRFQNLVYSVPRRMGLSPEDAQDVFQTTFLALHRNLDRIDEPGAVAKWLSVTASRESLRIVRTNMRSAGDSLDASTLEDVVADEESSAEENSIRSVEADAVRQGVLDLPAKCKELLTLLYLADDVSYEEVSERLHMAIGSIGPTRARCLEKLRRALSSSGFFGEPVYQKATDTHH